MTNIDDYSRSSAGWHDLRMDAVQQTHHNIQQPAMINVMGCCITREKRKERGGIGSYHSEERRVIVVSYLSFSKRQKSRFVGGFVGPPM